MIEKLPAQTGEEQFEGDGSGERSGIKKDSASFRDEQSAASYDIEETVEALP